MLTKHTRQPLHDESGYILIASLIVMLVLSVIALSLLTSNTVQESISNNFAQKELALQSANSAMNYAKAWITQNPLSGTPSDSSACTGGTVSYSPVICTASSSFDPDDLTLPSGSSDAVGTTFQPVGLNASTNGGINTVYQLPRYNIQYEGVVLDGQKVTGTLYKITSAGYGGNSSAVAIVQAYYRVYSASTNITGE